MRWSIKRIFLIVLPIGALFMSIVLANTSTAQAAESIPQHFVHETASLTGDQCTREFLRGSLEPSRTRAQFINSGNSTCRVLFLVYSTHGNGSLQIGPQDLLVWNEAYVGPGGSVFVDVVSYDITCKVQIDGVFDWSGPPIQHMTDSYQYYTQRLIPGIAGGDFAYTLGFNDVCVATTPTPTPTRTTIVTPTVIPPTATPTTPPFVSPVTVSPFVPTATPIQAVATATPTKVQPTATPFIAVPTRTPTQAVPAIVTRTTGTPGVPLLIPKPPATGTGIQSSPSGIKSSTFIGLAVLLSGAIGMMYLKKRR